MICWWLYSKLCYLKFGWGTGQGSNSHFMQSVKRRNVVLFHSCAHVFLTAQLSCYHLTKGNMEITWKVGLSWCYGRLHAVRVRYTMHSQGSVPPLALCCVTSAQARLRAWLCFALSRLGAVPGMDFSSCCRDWSLGSADLCCRLGGQ